MENNHDLGVDSPVVKVWNESLEYEFKWGEGTNLVFMFPIQTLE
jgi:hypothetical protein